jgi:crotonobetainyl-CoA:carnitine CoA-transferase CaiB-like acyl-CoA transferase
VTFKQDKNHPCERVVEHIEATAVRSRYARMAPLVTAEKYGKSTQRVLTEIGYSQQEINQLLEKQVISETWSKQYLPN